jgi:hypothetical protein
MMRRGREGDKRAVQIHEKRKETETQEKKRQKGERGEVKKTQYQNRGSRIQLKKEGIQM